MPLLSIITNVAKSKIPGNLPSIISEEFQKLMNKPTVFCQITPDCIMSLGGSGDLCAMVNLVYIGDGNAEKHAIYSKRMSEMLKEYLGIPINRKMPLLNITTNVSKSKVPEGLPIIFSQEFAKLMGKPIDYVACNISTDNIMAFGGSSEPCALVTLTFLGQASAQKHATYSKRMSELLHEHLGISKNRYYLHFVAASAENIGYQGHTFAS